jgi:hypothetical protein
MPRARRGPKKISVARLPITGSDVFGREEDVAFLDAAWTNQKVNIVFAGSACRGERDHPNVASVFHLGRKGRDYFYAMEFVEGETLDNLVKRSGPLEVKLALEICGYGCCHCVSQTRGGWPLELAASSERPIGVNSASESPSQHANGTKFIILPPKSQWVERARIAITALLTHELCEALVVAEGWIVPRIRSPERVEKCLEGIKKIPRFSVEDHEIILYGSCDHCAPKRKPTKRRALAHS